MFSYQLNPQEVNNEFALLNKVGTVKAFAGTTPPDGWLFCDGAAISRTTYAALFAVIGTTYGAGDGSTTFNLPDLLTIGSSAWANVRGNGKAVTFTDGTNWHPMNVNNQWYMQCTTNPAGMNVGDNLNPNMSFIQYRAIGITWADDGSSGLTGLIYGDWFAQKARAIIKY